VHASMITQIFTDFCPLFTP